MTTTFPFLQTGNTN